MTATTTTATTCVDKQQGAEVLMAGHHMVPRNRMNKKKHNNEGEDESVWDNLVTNLTAGTVSRYTTLCIHALT